MPVKRSQGTPAQCKAITASGQQCKAKPHKEGLCFFHSDPQRAAELGRKGGRRRAVYNRADLAEVRVPKTAADLRDLLARCIVEIRQGKMDPKLANSISYLGTVFLRAVEVADVQSAVESLQAEQRRVSELACSQVQIVKVTLPLESVSHN